MTRAAVRSGIAEFFGGPTYDDVSRIYRPTPLAASGLAGVRPYFGKRVPDSDYTFGLTAGRAMGGIIVVHLAQEQERRIALGGATGGVKRVPYAVTLHLYHLAQTQHAETAQADVDDLLDAIKDLIHGDRTLGGTVTEAGESANGIITRMDLPVIDGERTESYAVIAFDAVAYIEA